MVKDDAGKTPVWNQTFDIDVKYVGDDLYLEILDEDVCADDKVGETSIKLSALCANNGIDEWFSIAYKGKPAGHVHLKSVYKPVVVAAQPVMQYPMMQ